jgi:hypothetical protein
LIETAVRGADWDLPHFAPAQVPADSEGAAVAAPRTLN